MSYTEKEFLAEARPLAEGLISYAMAKGKKYGISDAEVKIIVNEKLTNALEKGEVSQVSSGKTRGILITLYAGDRTMSFRQNTFNMETLTGIIDQVMNVIKHVPENKDARLLEKEKVYKGPVADLDIFDKKQPSQEELIAYAQEIEAAAEAQGGIKMVESASASKYSSHYLALATNGLDYHVSSTRCSAGASVIAEDARGMQAGGDSSMARHFSDMASAKDIGERAAKKTLARLNATFPATGEVPIVLDREAAAGFFTAVFSAIDGTALHLGKTFLKGKLGQQVMSKGITIVDDPTVPRGLSSSFVDSNGMKMEKLTLVEDGVLKSYWVNLTEARQLGIEPIGRDDDATNVSVLPGTQTPEELMADIQEGIYILGFDGGSLDANTGIFSKTAYGKVIRNGKVTDESVDGFVVTGNLKDMFMSVSVANDTPAHPNTRTSFATPTTRINKAMIAGK